MIQILTNQIGYLGGDYKRAVFQGMEGMKADAFRLINRDGGVAYNGHAKECGKVANWNTGYYWTMDFSEFNVPGQYHLELDTSEGVSKSYPFDITADFQDIRMMNAVSYYFKAQRVTGEWEEADSHLPFKGGREGMVDGRGGWLDASGDYVIHMSHLSHSTVCNPQQAAFSAYVFFKAVECFQEKNHKQAHLLIRRMLDEGTFGADFIMRMKAPSGSFFRSISRTDSFGSYDSRVIGFEYHDSSDQFSKVAATADQEQVDDTNYETSMRSGGGTCIAALAAAARHYYPGTAYTSSQYLVAAKEAWKYLWENNHRYTNDGQWNLLDEYCALLAVAELYQSTSEYNYLILAEELAERIMDRMEDTGEDSAWFMSRPGEPFCHAADEGLPVVALLTFAEIEPEEDLKIRVKRSAIKAMRHVLKVTGRVNNPFGYARYIHKTEKEERSEKFFYYHSNPAAPWWQGDNARIASLAAAAWMTASATEDTELAEELWNFGQNQINWILGMNPYDACMMEGYGRNNVQYFYNDRNDFMNCPGGICNGITSHPEDEEGILLVREPMPELGISDNWRWGEQWIPHGTWFIYALALKKTRKQKKISLKKGFTYNNG